METTTPKSEPNAIARATLVKVPSPTEPKTDTVYRCAEDGAEYRVRTIYKPVNDVTTPGGADAEPVTYAVAITITRLDDAKRVERGSSGKIIVTADTMHTIYINDGRDPEATVRETVERLVAQAVKSWNARKTLEKLVAATGVSASVTAK